MNAYAAPDLLTGGFKSVLRNWLFGIWNVVLSVSKRNVPVSGISQAALASDHKAKKGLRDLNPKEPSCH